LIFLFAYLKTLNTPRIVLWCYLIWYLAMAGFYFDPAPGIWLTSIGLSIIIGISLELSSRVSGAPRARGWTLFRLYLTPFCVSSFAALVKDRGFILIFSPVLMETGLAIAGCVGFWLMVLLLRRVA
jgi:hypothetical protein